MAGDADGRASGTVTDGGDGVVIAIEDPTTPDARELIRLLSAELAARYDFADDGSGAFTPSDVQVPRAVFLVARLGGRPIGCGALRPLDEAGFERSAEIKRMYVVPELRGRRIAGRILERLEALARDFGYARAVLETGDAQPEAIRLYHRAGYTRVPCYGRYRSDPRSACFARPL
jgi:GNAT superfamily N-acetyltransferase